MLKKVNHPVVEVDVPGCCGVRVDTDSSIFDNSQSKKEGVVVGYSGVAGYAPVCSLLEGGIVVDAWLWWTKLCVHPVRFLGPERLPVGKAEGTH
jgi:hypothetical protein